MESQGTREGRRVHHHQFAQGKTSKEFVRMKSERRDEVDERRAPMEMMLRRKD